MSLRTRILISVGMTLVALMAGIYFVSSRMIFQSFAGLEHQDAIENIDRADRSFRQMINDIHTKSVDWSSWDDTYRFIADGNQQYVRSNLNRSSLSVLNLDAIIYTDRKGRPFKSVTIRRSKDTPGPDPQEIVRRLGLARLNYSRDALKNGVSGFIRLPGESMLVSIRPILASNGDGPSRGWFIFGRILGKRELEILKGLTRIEVAVKSIDGPEVRPPNALFAAVTKAANGSYIAPLSDETIAGYRILKDLKGYPSLMISMRKSRAIMQQGIASIAQIRDLLLAAGLLFGTVILYVLEKFALSRLAKLSAEVVAIGSSSSPAKFVEVSGSDELSWLSTKINEMLRKLREGDEQLQGYNANLERMVRVRTQQMEHQAFHDKLTGLPNRALFMDRIRLALAKSRTTGEGVAAFFIDLDNFKFVNDSLGHSMGDALLVAVAGRLSDAVREGDTVARLGGDEFTVLLENLHDGRSWEEVACEILRSLRSPILLEGREVFVTASIGVAFVNDQSTDAEQLMKAADTAMYRAKENGKSSYVLYDEGMNESTVERLELETGLRKALDQGEISVQYQPLINLGTGSIQGAEALVRWNHPTKGAISPDRFVPIAEDTGLILPIGYWILEEACRQSVRWQAEFGIRNFCVSVNLSGKQLQRDDVVERVTDVLKRTGLPPACLKLEITETVLLVDRSDVVDKMQRLKKLGVKLALDDFGTGYSSLSLLSAFPFDTLKIDQVFIADLGVEREATAIVEAIMALSRSMRMDVTGEGIETVSQMRVLQGLGCQTGQGFLFDRPLTAEDLRHRLAHSQSQRYKHDDGEPLRKAA